MDRITSRQRPRDGHAVAPVPAAAIEGRVVKSSGDAAD
jgi:hypothetical protein